VRAPQRYLILSRVRLEQLAYVCTVFGLGYSALMLLVNANSDDCVMWPDFGSPFVYKAAKMDVRRIVNVSAWATVHVRRGL
jgi:hypothetical protein